MKRKHRNTKPVPWAITAGVLLTLGGLVYLGGKAVLGPLHPEPRAGVTSEHVLHESQLAGYPNEVAAYAAARVYPAVLDGLYCYCHCGKHSGHRSLLTCFESQHGASCEVCQIEANLAARMHREGATLEQIRQGADAQFRS